MQLKRPWPRGENVRSGWGMRTHPISGKRKHHRGVDVAYHGPIYAPADGVVVHKGADLNKQTGGGYTLIIRHSNPIVWTVYYHLRQPSQLLKGTKVRTGEIIGYTGTTGASTGVHLHFETRASRAWGTDFDPMRMLGLEHAEEHEDREEDREEDRSGRKPPRVTPGRAAPSLKAWSNSWMKRGEWYDKQ